MGATETPIQQNLVAKNKEYASTFTKGHLALPPAKKYTIGVQFPPEKLSIFNKLQ